MKRDQITAGILSLGVPGLGQMYKGHGSRGAIVLFGAIVISSLDIMILPLISMANPIVPPAAGDVRGLWAYWIPRIVHDILAVWSIIFWLWAAWDAASIERPEKEKPE